MIENACLLWNFPIKHTEETFPSESFVCVMAEIVAQKFSPLHLLTNIKSSTDSNVNYDADAILTRLTTLKIRDDCNNFDEDKFEKPESNTYEAVIKPVKLEDDKEEGSTVCIVTDVQSEFIQSDVAKDEIEKENDDGNTQLDKELRTRGPPGQKKARIEGENSNYLVPNDSFSSKDLPVISPHLYEPHSISTGFNNSSVLGEHTHVEWKSNDQQNNGTNHNGEFTPAKVKDVMSNIFNFNSNQQESNFSYSLVTPLINAERSPTSHYQQTYDFESNENTSYTNGYQQSYVNNSQINVGASFYPDNRFSYGNNNYPVTVAEATYVDPSQLIQSYHNAYDSNSCYNTPYTQSGYNFAEGEMVFGNLFFDANELSADYFSSGEIPILSGLEVDNVMAELDQQCLDASTMTPLTFSQLVSCPSSSATAIPTMMSQCASSEPKIRKKPLRASAQSASYASSILPQIPTTVASVSMQNEDYLPEQELPANSQCRNDGAQAKCVGSANKTQQLPTHRSSPVHSAAKQKVPGTDAKFYTLQ